MLLFHAPLFIAITRWLTTQKLWLFQRCSLSLKDMLSSHYVQYRHQVLNNVVITCATGRKNIERSFNIYNPFSLFILG